MAQVKHKKTNTVPAWTQADLNAQIALGNVPPGTTLAGFTLSTDWNDDHLLTGFGAAPLSTGTTATYAFDPEISNVNLGDYISQLDAVSGSPSAVATGSARPVMGTLYNRRVIDFQGNQELNIPGQSIDPRNFTFVFVTDISNFLGGSGNGQGILAGLGGSGTRSFFYNNASVTGFDATAGTVIGYGGTYNAGTFNIVTITGNATNIIARCNGVELFTSPAFAASPNFSNIRLGRAENLVQSLIGKIAYFEYFNTALNATDRANNENRIRALIPVRVPSASLPRFFFVGNSLVEGRGNSNRSLRWADRSMLTSNLADKDNFLVRGYAGATTTQLNGAISTILTQYMGTGTNSFTYVWELSNGVNISKNGTTEYNNLKTLCASIKAQSPNTKIIAMTMLPRGTDPAVESARIVANGLVMASTTLIAGQTYGYTKGVDNIDFVLDVAGITAIGAPGSQSNTTYYTSDLIHLNDTGYGLISPEAAKMSNALALSSVASSGGSGDVSGPASSTDNAIARYDGTTGKIIQNSSATIDDSGNSLFTGNMQVNGNSQFVGNNIFGFSTASGQQQQFYGTHRFSNNSADLLTVIEYEKQGVGIIPRTIWDGSNFTFSPSNINLGEFPPFGSFQIKRRVGQDGGGNPAAWDETYINGNLVHQISKTGLRLPGLTTLGGILVNDTSGNITSSNLLSFPYGDKIEIGNNTTAYPGLLFRSYLSSYTGQFSMNGVSFVMGAQGVTNDFAFNLGPGGGFLPFADGGKDLGTSSNRWGGLYTAGNIVHSALASGGTPPTPTGATRPVVADTNGLLTLANSPVVATSSMTMVPNTIYLVDSASLVTLTLPATFNQFDTFQIIGKGAGGWKVAQASGQTIRLTSTSTTTGTGGSLASSNRYDNLVLRGITANTELSATARNGNLTVV